MIDYQIAAVMPNVQPPPSSATKYAYWERYLDYIIWPVSIMSGTNTNGVGSGGSGSGGGGLIPLPHAAAAYDSAAADRRRGPQRAPRPFALQRADDLPAMLLPAFRPGDAALLATALRDRPSPREDLLLALLYPPPPPPPAPGTPPNMRGSLPASQNGDRIIGFNNPNTSTYAAADTTVPASYRNWIGYLTYTQFMMDYGRDLQPLPGQYVPLSRN